MDENSKYIIHFLILIYVLVSAKKSVSLSESCECNDLSGVSLKI